MLKNEEAAKEYEKVKKSLDLPRDQYPQAKTKIIKKILEDASKDIKL